MGKEMFRKLNYVLDKGQKIRLFILLILIIGGSFLETLGVSSILPIAEVITNPDVIKTDEKYIMLGNILNISDLRTYILVLACVLMGIYIFKNIYLIFMYDVQFRFTINNKRKISYRLMDCYLNQEYLFHVDHNVAELQRNVSTDVDGLFQILTQLIQLTTEGITCLMLVTMLLIQDIYTTLVIIIIMSIFLYIVLIVFRKKLVKLGEKGRVLSAKINQSILEAFGGIKEIKVNGNEQYFLNNYDERYRNNARIMRINNMLEVIPRPTMETLCICGILGFVAIRIYLGAAPSNFVATMSVFAVAAIRMLPSFNRISNSMRILMYNKASLEAVYNDMKTIEKLSQKINSEKSKTGYISINNEIKVDNISFCYPSRPDKKILDNASLVIPHNQSVAFIGASGAGKTTMADIILGVLRPQSGAVLADGVDVYENLDVWHDIIGYIPQSIYLMDDTLRANIAFGIDKAKVDDEKIWEALKEAQLEDFVREQPEGLDTLIGDRGVRLSGGQRQRIGIARALYRQPLLLVMDEATSALDTETESAVMEAVDRLAGKKTMIIIAHRLTTLRNCDIIYEIGDGMVKKRRKEDVI